MLAKKNRLTRNKDFEAVSKQGKSLANSLLVLKWVKNDLSYSRFGIVVSLKIDKRATRRNKIKRRLREIIRSHLDCIKSGYDFLIIARNGIKDKKFKNLKSSFLKLLKKANLYDSKVDNS